MSDYPNEVYIVKGHNDDAYYYDWSILAIRYSRVDADKYKQRCEELKLKENDLNNRLSWTVGDSFTWEDSKKKVANKQVLLKELWEEYSDVDPLTYTHFEVEAYEVK